MEDHQPFLTRLAAQFGELGLERADPLQNIRLTGGLASTLLPQRAWYPHMTEEGRWQRGRLAVRSSFGVGFVQADAVFATAVGARRAFSGAPRLLPPGGEIGQPVYDSSAAIAP